jgi:hypothetical protein
LPVAGEICYSLFEMLQVQDGAGLIASVILGCTISLVVGVCMIFGIKIE